jgi:hypothetical protein
MKLPTKTRNDAEEEKDEVRKNTKCQLLIYLNNPRGDATVILSRKNHFTVAYWSNLQFVMALLPPARPRYDDNSPWIKCSRLFSWSNRSRVASVGERPSQETARAQIITSCFAHGTAITPARPSRETVIFNGGERGENPRSGTAVFWRSCHKV